MNRLLESSLDPLGPLTLYKYFDQLPKNISNSTYFDKYDDFPENKIEKYSDNFYLTTSFIFIFYILTLTNNNHIFDKFYSKVQIPKYFQEKYTDKRLKFRLSYNIIIYFTISIVLLPLVVFFSLLFILYRFVILIILKIQYGRDFHGLFTGQETVWALEDNSKSIITVKILLETPENENVHKKIMEKMKILSKKYKKLGYVKNRKFGYFFWRQRTNNDFEDFIKTADMNVENHDDFIKKYCNRDLPMENEATWEIFIGTNSTFSDIEVSKLDNRIKQSPETKLVPIIFKIHHSVGDGISLISFLLKNLSDHNDFTKIFPETKKSILENIFLNFCLWFFAPGFAIYQFLTRKKDVNIFHGPDLSGEKVVGSISDEGKEIFDCVKRSKNCLGYTFTEIILGAISEAFWQHFQDKQADIPDYLTVVVPIFMGNDIPSDLENNFSLGMVNLPINVSGGLAERLSKVRMETEYLRHALDYKLNYMMCKVASKYFPADLIQSCLQKQSSTCSISNVPGPMEEISILDGCRIKDIVFWLPNKGHTGLGISILGYNNKLRLGLLADKTLIKDNDEARIVLQKIVGAIHKIDDLCSARTTQK